MSTLTFFLISPDIFLISPTSDPSDFLLNRAVRAVEVEKGEVLAYAEEVCSNVETIGVQKVEVAEKGVQRMEKGKFPSI